MIDGSLLAYEDNVKLTKTVVELAHGVDVSVEGEIGTIGALSDSVEGGVEQVTYTKPEEVTDFLTRTNADTLAVAIGTAPVSYTHLEHEAVSSVPGVTFQSQLSDRSGNAVSYTHLDVYKRQKHTFGYCSFN